jgi:hypothetical protein
MWMRPRKRARYVFCKLMLGSLRRPHPVYRVEVQAVPSSRFASALPGCRMRVHHPAVNMQRSSFLVRDVIESGFETNPERGRRFALLNTSPLKFR